MSARSNPGPLSPLDVVVALERLVRGLSGNFTGALGIAVSGADGGRWRLDLGKGQAVRLSEDECPEVDVLICASPRAFVEIWRRPQDVAR